MVYFSAAEVLNYKVSAESKPDMLLHLNLPDNFRLLTKGDIKKQFFTGEPLMDRYGLEYYYRRSTEQGSLVLVLQDRYEIAGLSLLTIGRDSITIEMLARNRNSRKHGIGAEMLHFIEEDLAVQLSIDEIRLESLNREKLVDFYMKNGFVRNGSLYFDREWGILFPMKKRILSLEN